MPPVQTAFSDIAASPYEVTSKTSDLLDSIAGGLGSLGLSVIGSDQGERMYGTAYADFISGMGGNDVLYGMAGDDLLFGGAGRDTLYGGDGDDVLDGGADNDYLFGGLGADTFIGGAGFDTVSYANSTRGIVASLVSGGNFGEAIGDSFNGVERLIGSQFSDTLSGDVGNNRLEGSGGNDRIHGGDGFDVLDGGIGSDTLAGEGGLDILTGGADRDTFVLDNLGFRDVVADFVSGVDRLDVRALGATFNLGSVTHLVHTSYSEGTEIPDVVHFDLRGPIFHQNATERHFANHLFFDTDDHILYVLDVTGSISNGNSSEFDIRAVAYIDGISNLDTHAGSAGLLF